LPCDIYNYDEIGFRIGIGEGQWILILDLNRPRYIRSLCDRELASALKAISDDGVVLSLWLILQGKRHMVSWFENLSDVLTIIVSDSGYLNNEIAYKWLKHFEK